MHLGRYIHGILTFILWRVYNLENLVPSGCSVIHSDGLILTLERHADDHEGLWPSGGAGQCTDEIPQTARDPTSLSAQH